MIVVDASVLANAVGDDDTAGAIARAALSGNDLELPDLVDVEVASVLRRRWLAKTMTAKRFFTAISDLASVPADRYPVLPFMPTAYELRSNVSPYDAAYLALARPARVCAHHCRREAGPRERSALLDRCALSSTHAPPGRPAQSTRAAALRACDHDGVLVTMRVRECCLGGAALLHSQTVCRRRAAGAGAASR